MEPKNYLPLRDRLILNFVFFGVIIILVIGAFSYYTARDILLDRTFNQLTSVRVVKKRQIESFFADRSRDIKMISSSEDAGKLLQIMKRNELFNSQTEKEAVSVYTSYLARYLKTQNYYQTFYLFDNYGNAIKFNTIAEDSIDGLKFINPDNMELDDLWNSVIQNQDISIVDHNRSNPMPGLFIVAPVFDNKNNMIECMIALEISMDAINKIMYENNPYEGLGESGESYLVGEDLLMRSTSRFQDNSILNTNVATFGVQQAFLGRDSTAIIDDYRGIKVLSSYSKVDITGLNWVILAEIDLSEAQVPLNAILINILLISSFIILFLFFAALFLSNRITSPLVRLKDAAQKIGQGDFNTDLVSYVGNEIGDLMNSFNYMAESLEEKTSELRKERFKRLRSVIDGQEIERQRLSRELHDGLGQRLIALKLKLENVKSKDQCDTMQKVKEVKTSFDETIDEIRRMSNNLMPAVLYEFGISTALRNLVGEISDSCRIKGKFISKGKVEELNKTTKTYLYRIAQEAVNNSVKHAEPNSIIVELIKKEESVSLIIKDDGNGFDPLKDTHNRGNGLHNMRERSGLLQGTLSIDAGEDGGTIVAVTVPLNSQITIS